MSRLDREHSTQLKVGEMPTPRYLLKAGDTTGEGSIKWIGVEAYSSDGEIKPFLWWRNFQVGDLNDPTARHHAAGFIARLKMVMEADSVIGPAIDLDSSNQATGKVKIDEEEGLSGVYIEAQKRGMFNFFAIMRGIKSEAELREQDPVRFDEFFQKAKEYLPRPKETTKDKKEEKPEFKYNSLEVEFEVGDITKVKSDAIITLINSSGMWFGGVDSAIQRVTPEFHGFASSYMSRRHGLKDGSVIFANGGMIPQNRDFRSVIFVIDDIELPLGKLVEAGLDEAYEKGLQVVTLPLMRSGVMAGVKEKTLKEVAAQMLAGIKASADRNPSKPLRAKIIAYSDPDGARVNTLKAEARRSFRVH